MAFIEDILFYAVILMVGCRVFCQNTATIKHGTSCYPQQCEGDIKDHLKILQGTVNEVMQSQDDLENGQTEIKIEQIRVNQRVNDLERKQTEIELELNKTHEYMDDLGRGQTIMIEEDEYKTLIQKIHDLEKKQNFLEQLIRENLKVFDCPKGFEISNDTENCYYLTNITKNWADARNHCQDLGSDLVSVETEAEHIFLKEMIRRKVATGYFTGIPSYWTSGTDAKTEGNFTWEATGQGLSYDGWNPGEPNDLGGAEDCIGLYSRLGFNDEKCHLSTFFICEKKMI